MPPSIHCLPPTRLRGPPQTNQIVPFLFYLLPSPPLPPPLCPYLYTRYPILPLRGTFLREPHRNPQNFVGKVHSARTSLHQHSANANPLDNHSIDHILEYRLFRPTFIDNLHTPLVTRPYRRYKHSINGYIVSELEKGFPICNSKGRTIC